MTYDDVNEMELAMKLLSVAQAAEQLGYSKETLRRWIAEGKLSAKRLPSGRIRIEVSELQSLLKPSGHE